jgi:hypothetical protein
LKAEEIRRSIEGFDVAVVSGPYSFIVTAVKKIPEFSALANKGVEDVAHDDGEEEEHIAMQLDSQLNGLGSFPLPGTEEGDMKPDASEN